MISVDEPSETGICFIEFLRRDDHDRKSVVDGSGAIGTSLTVGFPRTVITTSSPELALVINSLKRDLDSRTLAIM